MWGQGWRAGLEPGGNASSPLARWPGHEPISSQPQSEAGLGLRWTLAPLFIMISEQAGGKKGACGASFHLAAPI